MEWGWSVSQLAEWLCRIVVGDVVREEEREKGARGHVISRRVAIGLGGGGNRLVQGQEPWKYRGVSSPQ